MSKYFSILFLLLFLFYSCGNKNNETESDSYKPLNRSVDKNQFESAKFKVKISAENLTGFWISTDNNTGFELSEGGIAVSFNNAKLEYNSWELIEDKLILNSTTKAGKTPEPFKEIYIIRELFKDSMELSPSNDPEQRYNYIRNK